MSMHPLLAIALIAWWLGLLVVAVGTIVFSQGSAAAGRMRKRAKEKTKIIALFPSLLTAPLRAWERTLFWSGSHNRLPRPRILVWSAAVFVILAGLVGGVGLGLVALVSIGLGMYIIIFKAKRAQTKFIHQLPDSLQSLVDTLRAGYALPQAMVFLSREVAPPMQAVFGALVRGHELDLSFHEALRRTAIQMQIPEWTMVAETLSVQQHLGGNIIPFLEETAKTVRDRIAVEQEIKTMTAAGRMSGYLVAALVPIVIIFFFLLSPSYISILFTQALGRILFTSALVLEVIGFIWIRRIVRIDY